MPEMDSIHPIVDDNTRKMRSNLAEMKFWLTGGRKDICPNCGASVPKRSQVWCSWMCRDSVTTLCAEYGYPTNGPRSSMLAAWLGVDSKASCSICGVETWWSDFDLDHRIALVNGGRDHLSNWQFLCQLCHKEKTRRDLGLMARYRRFGQAQMTIFGGKALDSVIVVGR